MISACIDDSLKSLVESLKIKDWPRKSKEVKKVLQKVPKPSQEPGRACISKYFLSYLKKYNFEWQVWINWFRSTPEHLLKQSDLDGDNILHFLLRQRNINDLQGPLNKISNSERLNLFCQNNNNNKRPLEDAIAIEKKRIEKSKDHNKSDHWKNVKMLYHYVAEHCKVDIFREVINQIQSDVKVSEIEFAFHSISKSQHDCLEKYQEMKSSWGQEINPSIEDQIQIQDDRGNIPLHLATKNVFSDEIHSKRKLDFLKCLLKDGSDISLLNNDAENFRSQVKKMQHSFFDFDMIPNEDKLLDLFVNYNDDILLETIFTRVRSNWRNAKHHNNSSSDPFDSQTCPKARVLINLINKTYHKRDSLKNSFAELMAWHGECHKNSLEEVRLCCFKNIDPTKAYIVFDATKELIKTPISFSYYGTKVLNFSFLIILALRSIDFATDITMTTNFYHLNANSSLFEDFPSEEECENDFKTACFFHQMNMKTFFWTSLMVFIMVYLAEVLFLMSNEKTCHYKSVLSGFCCWQCCRKFKLKSKRGIFKYIIWATSSALNQILVHIYAFVIETFVDYWRTPFNKKVENVTTHVSSYCTGCRCNACRNDECVCIFCSSKMDNGQRANLRDGKYGLEILEDYKNHTSSLSKLVTLSTEDSFMPLIQLSILFPIFLSKIPQTDDSINKKDINQIVEHVGNNWRFFVILSSIVSSILSLSSSLTSTYFSKPGKSAFMTFKTSLLYFVGVLFQVVPKLFSFQLFAFGVVGKLLGPNYIIPSLIILPMLIAILVGTLYFTSKNSDNTCNLLQVSSLLGLSSIYTYVGIEFLWKDESSQERTSTLQPLQQIAHIIYDTTSFILNIIMALTGAKYIDEKVDIYPMIYVAFAMHFLGLILKGAFYLYVHPWTMFKTYRTFYVVIHALLCIVYICGICGISLWLSWNSSINTFIICLYSTFGLLVFVSIFFIQVLSLLLSLKLSNEFSSPHPSPTSRHLGL